MIFSWVDAIALGMLALMFIRGWWVGFILMAGNLLSLIVGVIATAWFFAWASSWSFLANWHMAHPVLAIAVFIAVLGIVVRLLRLVVRLVHSLYRIVSMLPFMGFANRVLGALVGGAQGAVVLTVIVYLLQNIVFAVGWFPLDLQTEIQGTATFLFVHAMLDRLAFFIPALAIAV